MKVVTYIEAARIAGVTRQRISNIRTDIENGECKHQFLAYSMELKKQGIDIDHPDWKHYCEKNKNHLIKRNRKKKETVQISIDNESPKNDVNNNKIKDFVLLCMSVAKKHMDQKNYNEFKSELTIEYQKVKK